MIPDTKTTEIMSTGEIVLAVLTCIGLLLGILKVWIQSQTDLAKVQAIITAINQRQDKSEAELEKHKRDDNFRYEQMRKENREDHRQLFEKIDKIIPFIKNN